MKLGVIGAGAWGTALAQVAARGDSPVTLWARESEVVDAINARHENSIFLPGVALSPTIRATDRLSDLDDLDALLVVVPTQHIGAVLGETKVAGRPLILCAKGIEAGSKRLVSEVAADAHPDSPLAVLSGPTFAHEVAAGLPTAVTLACADEALARRLSDRIASATFRPYASNDVVGAEIGGAVKNVLAIACGVVEGAGLSLNARASLIARGFAEMTRFGMARGARQETLAGLAGLGDLVLTCSSTSSRNFSLGVGLGQGIAAEALLSDRKTVAEGAATAPVLREAARDAGVEMPIAQAVCDLLGGAPLDAVMDALLQRPLRPEGV
ncbi:NAD(P)H-dependent glycerol-3-phosphate dehydrogenase [Stakelama pacifica]|uniref:Glycerol-3-phosphate dehydrogenase [NAD(P)+] n=1 Tax=Stakelama pacifica TaxID=517720 RepID=A0A4R6FUT8_9SPHN|nr:NAD(P)H-dependent glycerol-3-phosphate dehydrogenase [Stakelama pacifica]TDN85649.1 glycerol-3-phosphate dehydrogenase (NAD(P)+) [Stakelama pacifica]GGO92038.1 glycerol-3-phosphate dehydrogenase [NAD(P)+] [Stakelama pacifica]